MGEDLKLFIEENADLIAADDFETLYEKAVSTLGVGRVGRLTSIFLSVNIDPLEDLTYIPKGYL